MPFYGWNKIFIIFYFKKIGVYFVENNHDSQVVTLNVNKVAKQVRFDKDKPVRVFMKKTHPCGNAEFILLRVGMDFKLQCVKCGHVVMGQRGKIEKNIKKIIEET